MAEHSAPVPVQRTRPVVVNYRCDFCEQADVEPTGVVLTSDPPQYPHVCPRCKKTVNLKATYPQRRDEVIPTYLDTSQDPAVLQGRVELLADALGKVLVAAGLVRKDHEGMTGPELLLAADDFVRSVEEREPGAFSLKVDDPVQRSDGRYYVPVSKVGESAPPMLRVSTDAFPGDMDNKVNLAIEFACDLAARWNRGPC